MLWIPAFARMTKETDGLDKSSPYIYLDRQARRLSYGFMIIAGVCNTPLRVVISSDFYFFSLRDTIVLLASCILHLATRNLSLITHHSSLYCI